MALGAFVVGYGATTDAFAYERDPRLLDHTAHTLGFGRVRLGLFEWDAGVAPFVDVGVDTVPWAAGLVLRSVAPNAHAKIRLFRSTPLTVSARGGLYYVGVRTSQGDRGSLFIAPVSLFASSEVSSRFSVHVEATYAHVGASANADVSSLAAGAVRSPERSRSAR